MRSSHRPISPLHLLILLATLPLIVSAAAPPSPAPPAAAPAVAAAPATVSPVTTPATATAPATTTASTQPDTHMRSPADELRTFTLPAGYHLELIASDPDLISPSIVAWDGNGRMYVAEMRTYMLDINGVRSHTRASRVSRWEDTKGTGTYDKHTVFADKLMLPRMILPLDDHILIRETDTKDIYAFRDIGGDGVADERVRVYEGGVQEGNLEHQPSGLLWDIDNWIYVTNQDERFRYTRGKMEKNELPIHPGQWGIAMSDTGQLIFATAGSERPAHNFQAMPQYGNIILPGELADGFTEVFPLVRLPDVEGGTKRLKPEGGLNVFTGACGGSVFRGDALPKDLYGDYILPEPVGRLIRRARLINRNGKTIVTNAYEKKEFIASTDPNFRPVWTATGPDGCLYICDMYRGIIQEANWTKEGSYLRPQIQKLGLDKNIDGGRIFRLVHDDFKRRPAPRMLDETPEQLIAHLADPNGWWRDTAQKLIILRGDKSIVPALTTMATSHANPLARLHALWTLEGLDSVNRPLLIEKLKDPDPRLRAACVRIAEPLIKADSTLLALIAAAGNDSSPNVAAQACLSITYSQPKDADLLVNALVSGGGKPDAKDSFPAMVMNQHRENLAKAKAEEEKKKEIAMKNPALAAVFEKGRGYYGQTCLACHGPDGRGAPGPEKDGLTLAPSLRKSTRLNADPAVVSRLVLNGLTGVNEGKTYPGQMPSFKWADDEWLAAILSYTRNSWGNKSDVVLPQIVAAARKETAARNKPYTVEELLAIPVPTTASATTAAEVVKPATRPATAPTVVAPPVTRPAAAPARVDAR
jgi:mono/diheme cytochrome c family protein